MCHHFQVNSWKVKVTQVIWIFVVGTGSTFSRSLIYNLYFCIEQNIVQKFNHTPLCLFLILWVHGVLVLLLCYGY